MKGSQRQTDAQARAKRFRLNTGRLHGRKTKTVYTPLKTSVTVDQGNRRKTEEAKSTDGIKPGTHILNREITKFSF